MTTIQIGNSAEDLRQAIGDLFILAGVSLSLSIRLEIDAGDLSPDDAAMNLRGFAEGMPDRVQTVLDAVARSIEREHAPLFTVIDGGKTD